MKATKSFKIGEYAIGGIIRVQAFDDGIIIQALEYSTKAEVEKMTLLYSIPNFSRIAMEYLEYLTTHYYAQKVMAWIQSKVQTEN